MIKQLVAGLCLLLAPSLAFSFPIAVSAIGAGLLGALALPAALLVGAVVIARKVGAGPLHLMATAIAVVFCVVLMRDYGAEQASKAALFTSADTSFLSHPIPFPFLDAAAQARSSQAVTTAEFMEGLQAGHFKALKLSTYASLFTDAGQVSIDDLWRDKDVLVDAVEQRGGRVVLVDEYGGIAGSVAEAAHRNFGLNLGFLQGGTAALSQLGWKRIDEGDVLSGTPVAVEHYREWIDTHPAAFILGVTTDREFVTDGWMFGHQTLTLADFVANYGSLIESIAGRPVFVAGFETNDTGATPIIVSLLAGAGIDVSYVLPDDDEILVKPAYFDSYTNDTRLISLEDMKRYVLHRSDVAFLDFSERPWALGVEYLKDRYHHLPMREVAQGRLAEFIQGLDKSVAYVGLSFDRRTAYHSLLAGELLTKNGGHWLGRFTQAGSFSGAYLTVEELNTEAEKIAYAAREYLAFGGNLLLGHGKALAVLFGLILSAPALLLSKRAPTRSVFVIFSMVATQACVLQVKWDYPWLESAAFVFLAGNAIGLACVAYWRRRQSRPAIAALSEYASWMPPKAGLLNAAAELGFRVPKGVVVAPQDVDRIGGIKLGTGRLIVRSATTQEALDHGATAGLYESVVCASPDEVQIAAERVFAGFTQASVCGFVLVQRYVEADWYGVIQFQSGDRSPYLVCEIGQAEDVTAGSATPHRFEFPIWDVRNSPRLARSPALALLALSRLGAFSIEFALRRGRLILLQVNQSKSRACAENRLLQLARKNAVEVGSAHADPLSAAVVAALAPGHVIAYGNRRFCIAEPDSQLRKILKSDLRALGFNPQTVEPKHLVAWVDLYCRASCLSEGCRADLGEVVQAIKKVADTLGRINRIASTMLAIGLRSDWDGEPRILPSSQVGALLVEGNDAEWAGFPVCPLAGFSALAELRDYKADEFPSDVIEATSPLVWVKDAASVLIGVRLFAIRKAIADLAFDGKAQELMDALESQVGDWRAVEQLPLAPAYNTEPQPIPALLTGASNPEFGWRIPMAGLEGVITTPDSGVAGGILLLDQCSMSYLKPMMQAKAVIARNGAITSHLMQHAAAMGMPVVLGAKLPSDLEPGDKVRVSKDGEVLRA
ncbi:PEP-utilizing enzyme [Pseudomonas aeruginosa]